MKNSNPQNHNPKSNEKENKNLTDKKPSDDALQAMTGFINRKDPDKDDC
ncbi:Uncharacterised protein [Chlamydia abortus]|uniref:Uncharacterized protein n=1 Tax=Paenibacillus residui TaxID=629724 RepID=A0ABW3DAZ9_9BACL|nr:hypothetical protein [Paenibacillus sp. 32O-W]SHE13926.1 Uncharacterised protein [Chlamydia abortus]